MGKAAEAPQIFLAWTAACFWIGILFAIIAKLDIALLVFEEDAKPPSIFDNCITDTHEIFADNTLFCDIKMLLCTCWMEIMGIESNRLSFGEIIEANMASIHVDWCFAGGVS